MATITDVSLSIHTQAPGSATVTVKGTMQFTTADVGKEYYLSIVLRGSDPIGDKVPANDLPGDELLHTFAFGAPPFQQAFKKIKVTQAGTLAFTEQRFVRAGKVDEDKGSVVVNEDPVSGGPIRLPRKDEIYAVAKLSPDPLSNVNAGVKSNIWTSKLGI